jgi:peptidoglycan/xylan/chitin deacetylase (PgdA/CDA1 family)
LTFASDRLASSAGATKVSTPPAPAPAASAAPCAPAAPSAAQPARGTGRLLSLSLDLDNLWSYMKTHGDAGWDAFPTYLPTFTEVVLPRLRHHGLTITFFIVGQDAALEVNRGALKAIADDGHEIGNHSFRHEPWLHLYSNTEIDEEIRRAEEHILAATGKKPIGFRGPGFSFSLETLRVLERHGYIYDASTFPTFLGPIARAYYFWSTRGMPAAERAKRKKLFGAASEGFRPLRPYEWDLGTGKMLEIPVTTMPLFRMPIHLSYLVYLARFSRALSLAYLGTWIALAKAARVEPSFLLHPLDFLGGDRVKELSFFPGMDLGTDFKLELFDTVVARLKQHFEIVTMQEHARTAVARGSLRVKKLAEGAGP